MINPMMEDKKPILVRPAKIRFDISIFEELFSSISPFELFSVFIKVFTSIIVTITGASKHFTSDL
jgi:hypothetical protein